MLKKLLLLLALIPLAASAQTLNSGKQQPYLNISATNQLDGVSVNPNTAAAGKFTTLTATTVNGNTITTGTGTLTLGTGKTLTASNTLTFTGTDSTSFAFPSSSDTVVTLGATQTLTGKTLTSPVVTGPAPVACGSTCTLGAANVGAYTRLDTAGGSAATLPAATGTGTTYKLYISVATTSAQDKVLLATTSDTIIGTAIGENSGTAKVFVGNASTYHSIQMPNSGSQPSGGFIGDTIVCTDVASTIWKCDINYQAGTTPTTPYSASTT